MRGTFYWFGLTALVLTLLGAGCSSAPPAGNTALSPWAGTWNNFYSYLERPALDEAYAIKAKGEGKTQAEIKQRYLTGPTYQCEIAAMDITGNTITFYSTPQNVSHSTSGIAHKANYTDMGDLDINGRVWRYLKTSADVPHKHLLLLPAEADIPGKTMVHFHFRYGSDLEAMKNAESWFATMIAWDSTDALIIGHMTN